MSTPERLRATEVVGDRAHAAVGAEGSPPLHDTSSGYALATPADDPIGPAQRISVTADRPFGQLVISICEAIYIGWQARGFLVQEGLSAFVSETDAGTYPRADRQERDCRGKERHAVSEARAARAATRSAR